MFSIWKRGISSNSSLGLLESALSEASATRTKIIPIFSTPPLKTSPMKLNHLARLIKGMTLTQAKSQMNMVMSKRGKDVSKLITRIKANLSHNYGKTDEYMVQEAWVGKGLFLKRLKIMGRGRTGIMHRPKAILKIRVSPVAGLPVFSEDARENAIATSKMVEFKKLIKIFKQDRLFVTLKDKKPIVPKFKDWETKQWKYLTETKWIGEENAHMLHRKRPDAKKVII